MSAKKMIKLRFEFITVAVLSFKNKANEENQLNELEIFWSPGEDSTLKYDINTFSINGQHTNEYWHLVPDLEKKCDEDGDRIWQQTLWDVTGMFEINEQSEINEEVKEKLGCDLEIQSDHEVELEEFYWHFISVETIF